MKTDLRLRLHATQAQPCFPAASNALALPGGNGIFTATPTERITHYTLLRKVVCQMGALPPLETPTRKGGTLPLHGAHTAFSCYPALRLYRLSKSPRGIDVVSLTLGNSVLPFRHRLSCHITCLSNVILCKLILFSVKLNIVTYQNKYLQFNLYSKLYRQVAESKENIGCKRATLGWLLFNLAFYVYKAYIFSVPRCSNGLNSSLKESDFDQSILETNVPNERIAFLGFT